MTVEWEKLAECVWLLRGLPDDAVFGATPTEFTVVLVNEGGGIAKLLAGERIDTLLKARTLAKSIRDAGFTKAYAMRAMKKRWYV